MKKEKLEETMMKFKNLNHECKCSVQQVKDSMVAVQESSRITLKNSLSIKAIGVKTLISLISRLE